MGSIIRVGFHGALIPLFPSTTSSIMADYWDASGDEQDTCGGTKREKRLARNRESARKCRKKRKAFVSELADKVQALTEDNAMLELENRRLKQLQNGTALVPDSACKRIKNEQGVSVANDFSESAAGDFLLSAGHLDHSVALPPCDLPGSGIGCATSDSSGNDSRGPSMCVSDAEPDTVSTNQPVGLKTEPSSDLDGHDGPPAEGFVESFAADPCLSDLVTTFA